MMKFCVLKKVFEMVKELRNGSRGTDIGFPFGNPQAISYKMTQ